MAVIDVPGDEVVLIVIAATDAAAAERFVRDDGMRPIRVVPVRWDSGSPGTPVMDGPARVTRDVG